MGVDRRRRQSNLTRHENRIKVLLAGSLSEAKKFPKSDWEEIQGSCIRDWSILYAHAHAIAGIRGLPRPKRVNIMHAYPAAEEIVETLAKETNALIESQLASHHAGWQKPCTGTRP